MARYRIETTAQVRRVYEMDAEDERQAEINVDDRGAKFMVSEEDIGEEIDSVVLVMKANIVLVETPQ